MRKSFVDESSDDEEDDSPYLPDDVFTIIVLGARKSGKTSFINRLHSNTFSLSYTPTLCMEARHNVQLGDVRADIWEFPPNICWLYNEIRPVKSDAVIILFNSDETDSFENGIALWKTIRDRVNVHSTPELWVVDRGKAGMDTELCHPDRHFVVDSMTSEGFLDLSYDIRTALLRK
jgi:hypothetical protein